MNEQEIIKKFIEAHATIPANIDECAKLISDRDWFINHFPESKYNEPLTKYVEDIKRIYFEHESATNRFKQIIREE